MFKKIKLTNYDKGYDEGFEKGVKIGKRIVARGIFDRFNKNWKKWSEKDLDNAMIMASIEMAIMDYAKDNKISMSEND